MPEGPTFDLVSVTPTAEPTRLVIDFRALAAQKRFFRSRAFHPIYIGGYGAGKTFIGAMKALALAVINPGLPGALIAPTQQMAQEVVGQTLMELLDLHRVPYDYSPTYRRVSFPWGSLIQLRSAEKPHRLKGLNLAWVGVDEAAQISEEAWQVALSRVRHPRARLRQAFITTTPEGFNWLHRRFIAQDRPEAEVIRAATTDNPFLPPDYAARLADSLSPDLARQYLEGRFVNTATGRVYHAFSRREHVARLETQPDHPLALACDFNVSPMIWLVIQHAKGRVAVIGEIAINNADTGSAVRDFLARWPWAEDVGVKVYGDAAGHHRDTRAAGRTDYTIIRRLMPWAQLRVPRRNPAVRDRVNAVNSKLKPGQGEAELVIDPGCQELITDLEQLTYATEAAGSGIDKTDPGRTHASDALGYFIAREYPIRWRIKGFRY